MGARGVGPDFVRGRKQDVSREGDVRIKVAFSRSGHLAPSVFSCGKRPWAVWVSSYPAAYQSPPALPRSLPGHSLTPELGVAGEGRTGCDLSERWD